MKKVKLLLILLVFAFCPVQMGSALKVDNLEITPTGDLQPGDAVTVRGTVDLGSNGFDQDNYLEFYTQLDRPTVHWGYAVGLDDKYPPITTSGGSYLRINGWLLSYPEDMDVSVQVSLDGVVPESVSSGQLTVFRARHLDEDDDIVGTEFLRQMTISNSAQPEDTTAVEKALAQQSIDQAQQTIDSIIGLYNEFTMIRSLEALDPRLVPIIQKREIAISTLSTAKDEQAAGAYAAARALAIKSKALADEALVLCLALKGQLDGVTPTTTSPVTTFPVTPTTPSPLATTFPSPQPTKSGEIPLASVVLAGCSLVFIGLFHKRIR